MIYMIVETFRDGCSEEIYKRAALSGRMLPDGLEYIDSWVTINIDKCFQLMRTENEELIQEWVQKWNDLAHFEVIPVMPSKDASAKALQSSNDTV